MNNGKKKKNGGRGGGGVTKEKSCPQAPVCSTLSILGETLYITNQGLSLNYM